MQMCAIARWVLHALKASACMHSHCTQLTLRSVAICNQTTQWNMQMHCRVSETAEMRAVHKGSSHAFASSHVRCHKAVSFAVICALSMHICVYACACNVVIRRGRKLVHAETAVCCFCSACTFLFAPCALLQRMRLHFASMHTSSRKHACMLATVQASSSEDAEVEKALQKFCSSWKVSFEVTFPKHTASSTNYVCSASALRLRLTKFAELLHSAKLEAGHLLHVSL